MPLNESHVIAALVYSQNTAMIPVYSLNLCAKNSIGFENNHSSKKYENHGFLDKIVQNLRIKCNDYRVFFQDGHESLSLFFSLLNFLVRHPRYTSDSRLCKIQQINDHSCHNFVAYAGAAFTVTTASSIVFRKSSITLHKICRYLSKLYIICTKFLTY